MKGEVFNKAEHINDHGQDDESTIVAFLFASPKFSQLTISFLLIDFDCLRYFLPNLANLLFRFCPSKYVLVKS